ncbi:MAG: SoxR reducing system RseC family protein [Bacteroidales bacterium]
MAKKIIEHKGKIEDIEGNSIKVRFTSISACAACHAKGICSASDMESKEVEVFDDSGKFESGEEVNVVLQQSLGFRALFYGYVLPFLLVLVTLIIFSLMVDNEATAGIGALGILLPYYLVLYRYKDRLKKVFSFTIQKMS